MKFTSRGGKIILSAETEMDKSVTVSVRDSGIGMDSIMVANLFRLDTQTNRKGTEGEPSSGLGLLLCKELIEKHGGKIWAESEEGKGSAFYFTIPYHAESGSEADMIIEVPDSSKKNEIKKLKMLIVEDDETSEMLITLAVKTFSREILKARSGYEAVEACRNNPDIDLVMMDIKMPGMDGYEATKLIREFNKDLFIIAQTAFGLPGDKDKAIEAGCNEYFSKPINLTLLKGLLQKHYNTQGNEF